MNCPLCNLVKGKGSRTKVYFENDEFLILDDLDRDGSEKRILGMIKKHTDEPTTIQQHHLTRLLVNAAQKEIGNNKFDMEETLRSCPSHWHLHARSKK